MTSKHVLHIDFDLDFDLHKTNPNNIAYMKLWYTYNTKHMLTTVCLCNEEYML